MSKSKCQTWKLGSEAAEAAQAQKPKRAIPHSQEQSLNVPGVGLFSFGFSLAFAPRSSFQCSALERTRYALRMQYSYGTQERKRGIPNAKAQEQPRNIPIETP